MNNKISKWLVKIPRLKITNPINLKENQQMSILMAFPKIHESKTSIIKYNMLQNVDVVHLLRSKRITTLELSKQIFQEYHWLKLKKISKEF